MIVLACALTAIVVMGLHYLVEHIMDVAEKRRNCPHYDTYVSTTFGLKTKHCRDCGWQEPIREDLDG